MKQSVHKAQVNYTPRSGILGEMLDLALIMRDYKVRRGTELQLQDDLEKVFIDCKIPYEREVLLSKKDRPDFMLSGIAVECKVAGSAESHLRQIKRYMGHDSVRGCILVATRKYDIPNMVEGKPLWLSNVAYGNL